VAILGYVPATGRKCSSWLVFARVSYSDLISYFGESLSEITKCD